MILVYAEDKVYGFGVYYNYYIHNYTYKKCIEYATHIFLAASYDIIG